ncbi:PAS domain S-box protein [Zoogloea sp.]|uniref:PAS domain S-box protein n=1 Tax=Zoogloea sp. TaxID=49181 RepID=UPI0031FCA707
MDQLPYLAWGVGGLLAGALLQRLLRRQPEAALPPPQEAPPAEAAVAWQEFAELSGDWWWETDADLHFVDTPRPPPADLGLACAAGQSWAVTVMPDVREDFASALLDTLARRAPVSATLTRRGPDGEVRHLELHGAPRFDASGAFLGYRGVGRDVTERARLAAELLDNEERIHALLDCSEDGYWEQDADLCYTTLTARSGQVGDLAAEDTIGRHRWDLPGVAPSAEPWASHIARLHQAEPFSDFQFCRRDAHGRLVWLRESGIPVFDRRGAFAGYCGTTRNVTSDMEMRRRLMREAALFRRLFEHAPAAIVLVNAEGQLQQFNQAAADLLGRPAAALHNQPLEAFMEPSQASAWHALRQRCLQGEEDALRRDAVYLAGDGRRLQVRESLRRINLQDDQPASLVLALEDRSALQEALSRQEVGLNGYQGLFENAPEATLVCVNGRVRLANAAARRLFAAGGPDGLSGLELLELLNPDDRALEQARLAGFTADGQQKLLPPLPLRFRGADGKPLQAEATAVKTTLDGGPALIYMLRDVARWLHAEQVLRESQAMYRDVVESVKEILFQTDAEGRITFLNRAWHQTTGFDSRLSTGQNLLDFVEEEDRGRVAPHLRAVREGYEEIAEIEFRLRTRTGGPRWTEATLRPLRDTHDRTVGCSGTLTDITARKEAEQTQRNLNKELEARVRVRTAELEASNRELEAFSYSVSHDLRAPLRAIDGFAQIVAEDYAPRLDEIGKEYLQRIRVATQRMARLIDDLIDLARLTRQAMKREQVNLSLLVEQILGELQLENPERKVDIHIEPNLIAAADRALMRVALDNLLRNAWKFTSRREVASIRFHAELRDRQVVYCVSDNGAGFDMNFATKLFLPFHRLHGISEFAGTGIGLATVLRVIQRHEGRVWAESTPDEGAHFYFTLSH